MGASQSKSAPAPAVLATTPATTGADSTAAQDVKPKLKPCCACPETKKARDECVLFKGEENCQDLIEKHKQCLRDLGFDA
ncbi:Cytochrome c oxidase copper chaperone [Dimargaris verticillata]|uniref:Cytochrome c oxidase copper chaperone n=1 Tax=Dimargaris verticillata TaxID=2761393 RepID=A0A9W8B174_9FUNG|nr:Cytochrome c oxidase copper chaperone [Dimargaris verticillata]